VGLDAENATYQIRNQAAMIIVIHPEIANTLACVFGVVPVPAALNQNQPTYRVSGLLP
jgi:hypothetical protein